MTKNMQNRKENMQTIYRKICRIKQEKCKICRKYAKICRTCRKYEE
jgi:hypothetical protein